MLKPLIIVTGLVTLMSGASLAQTTTPPPKNTPPGSGSRAIGPTSPQSAEPVTPGTSTVPGRPTDTQKKLDSGTTGGGGGSGGGSGK